MVSWVELAGCRLLVLDLLEDGGSGSPRSFPGGKASPEALPPLPSLLPLWNNSYLPFSFCCGVWSHFSSVLGGSWWLLCRLGAPFRIGPSPEIAKREVSLLRSFARGGFVLTGVLLQ